uniref:Uncharacterized protein n=1 Tax=Anguilla anguilla TaxID=7936 RepID=A0A0E9RDX9_ANGAN
MLLSKKGLKGVYCSLWWISTIVDDWKKKG